MGPPGRSEWAANWPLLLSAIIGVPVPVAMTFLLGQFLAPLEHDFGWSRSQTSLGYSVSLVLGIFTSPLVGRLVDRTDARRLVLPGIVLTFLAMAAFALATPSIALWIALWCGVSLVGGLVGPTVWLAVVSAAFAKNRSMAISLTLCGMSLATMLAPLSARLAIDAVGWRMAWPVLALVWTAPAMVLALLFFFDRRPSGTPSTHEAGDAQVQPALGRTLLSGTFMRLALGFVAIGMVGSSYGIHLAPALADKGMNPTTAAAVAGIIGVTSILGTLGLGSLFDRLGQTAVTWGVMILFALASAILAQQSNNVPLAITGCLVLGLALGGMNVLMACIAARLFDGAIFGGIYGMLTSMSVIAAAIGPLAVSKLHDAIHSYAPAFWTGAGIAMFVGLLLTKLKPVHSADLAIA